MGGEDEGMESFIDWVKLLGKQVVRVDPDDQGHVTIYFQDCILEIEGRVRLHVSLPDKARRKDPRRQSPM